MATLSNCSFCVDELVQVARKVVKKVAVVEPRQWEQVVAEIRRMSELKVAAPEIARELGVGYEVVKQVLLQSYKMTADTVAVFERQEKARV